MILRAASKRREETFCLCTKIINALKLKAMNQFLQKPRYSVFMRDVTRRAQNAQLIRRILARFAPRPAL
jgi:hypothetical protein